MLYDITRPSPDITEYTIYKLTLNNKFYIGYTKNSLSKRLKQHIYSSRCSTPKSVQKHTIFAYAIRKYGEQNILCEVLEIVNDSKLALEREKYYIEFFDSTNRDKGYNMLKNSAYVDHATYNKDFYKTDSYRKKRSDVVKGESNGRYSGITDNQIIEKAVYYFNKFNNLYISDWFKFCKSINYPQNYDKKSSFRFNGAGQRGFQEEFIKICKERDINIRFEQMIQINTAKKAVRDLLNIFVKYFPESVDGNTINMLNTTWKDRESLRTKELNKRGIKSMKDKMRIDMHESIILEHSIKFFTENGHIHCKKFREYRKRMGLVECIQHLYNKEGEDGFRKEFLKRCINDDINITLEQFCCFNRLTVLNKIKFTQLYYDYYQKIKDPSQSI